MITIHPSGPADGARVVETWRAAVDATHGFLCAADRLAIEADVQQSLPEAPLWLRVDERLRAQGHGRRLLAAFTEEVMRRGVGQVFFSSYSFQAPLFYESAGYEGVSEIADWPPGRSNILLRKVFEP